jgi:hypothetical protein
MSLGGERRRSGRCRGIGRRRAVLTDAKHGGWAVVNGHDGDRVRRDTGELAWALDARVRGGR